MRILKANHVHFTLLHVIHRYDLYQTFVVVFQDKQARAYVYLQRFQLFAWGGALIPPTLALSLDSNNFITTDASNAPSLCWVDTSTDLKWAFVGPVIAMCCINLVATVLIIYEIRNNTKHAKFRAVM